MRDLPRRRAGGQRRTAAGRRRVSGDLERAPGGGSRRQDPQHDAAAGAGAPVTAGVDRPDGLRPAGRRLPGRRGRADRRRAAGDCAPHGGDRCGVRRRRGLARRPDRQPRPVDARHRLSRLQYRLQRADQGPRRRCAGADRDQVVRLRRVGSHGLPGLGGHRPRGAGHRRVRAAVPRAGPPVRERQAGPRGSDDWREYTAAVVEAGRAAYRASQSRDWDAAIEVTDQLNAACDNCHRVYRDVGAEGRGVGADRCRQEP